jgi:putative addiction module component (TIGR02574 family)
MKQNLVAEILELPAAERVCSVEAIWDSISASPDTLPLTQWQREELDRRLAEYEADPESGSTLEEVFARIRSWWYESQQAGLGEEFLTVIQLKIQLMLRLFYLSWSG